ncbi:MAG: response regulator [Caldilineaceae bacterium]
MDKHPKTTILIIDDESHNLRMMVEFLEAQGFRILISQDGGSGRQRAAYAQPDLILLDAILPDIDGFALCQQLKAQAETQEIPILFLTILTVPEDRLKALEVGAADYITKPVQWEELLLRINTQLRMRALTQRLAEVEAQLAKLIASKEDYTDGRDKLIP